MLYLTVTAGHQSHLWGKGKLLSEDQEHAVVDVVIADHGIKLQTKIIENNQIVAREDFDKVLLDPTKRWVMVFGFNSPGEDDPYLDSLRVCLDSEKFEGNSAFIILNSPSFPRNHQFIVFLATALVLKDTNMNTESLLEVATLGRQLHLGMLYDCCNDSFIPGVYLWDMDNIQKNKILGQSPKTSFNVHLTDSLEEKTKTLNISASLSASFLAGLVTVGGSASYLNNRSSSMHECRMTAQYSVRTKTEHLNLSQIGSATYKDIEDPKCSATHVVVQVEYGAEALMVFRETASDKKTKQDIQENMKLMVNKMGLFNISAEGKVQMTDEERKKVQNFTCTFHGDFTLEENPTNFEEAVKVYKSLPKLLGPNKENVVPKKVWLVPLTELVSSPPELKNEVSKKNSVKLQKIMEQLNTAQMRANDLYKDSDSIQATDITKKMKDFGENLQKYMIVWKENLFKLLPKIRKGVEKEEKLEMMLGLHEESPFAPSKVDAWLRERETELSVVKSYINIIKSRRPSVQIVAPEDFDKVRLDPRNRLLKVFGFNSLGEDDPYLDSLRVCLDSEKFTTMEGLPSDLQTSVTDETPWCFCEKVYRWKIEHVKTFRIVTKPN
ncbi:hypothetical protein MHYP_G00048250 [Metynnis hypsauchen]